MRRAWGVESGVEGWDVESGEEAWDQCLHDYHSKMRRAWDVD